MTCVRIPRFDCFASRLGCCRRGATIAEFGVAAALVVTAWGAVGSPRFQTIKDETCVSASRGSALHEKAMFNSRFEAAPCRLHASQTSAPA
jgi:hypothetical protein